MPRSHPAPDSRWPETGAENWQEWADRPRRSRVWPPVVFALVVQLVGTFGIVARHRSSAEAGTGTGTGTGPHTVTGLDIHAGLPLALLLAVIGPAALIGLRRFPGPAVAVTAAAAGTGIVVFHGLPTPYLSVVFAAVGAMVSGARLWAWISLCAAWIATLAVCAVADIRLPPATLVISSLVVLLSIGIAEGARSRGQRFAEARRVLATRRVSAAQAERVRIARELHDVLAHSLSVINVQASVGLHLFEQQPQKAAEALATIKTTSKDALDEVRQVLGVLRAEGDGAAPLVPEPELSRLPQLIEGTRAQGLQVEFANAIAEAPHPVQSALYRIVQESLTNVLKHAAAQHVAVSLGETDHDYLVAIHDDGHGHAVEQTSGNGLLGMRERVELLGGSFTAGRDGTGFAVSARIPKGVRP